MVSNERLLGETALLRELQCTLRTEFVAVTGTEQGLDQSKTKRVQDETGPPHSQGLSIVSDFFLQERVPLRSLYSWKPYRQCPKYGIPTGRQGQLALTYRFGSMVIGDPLPGCKGLMERQSNPLKLLQRTHRIGVTRA